MLLFFLLGEEARRCPAPEEILPSFSAPTMVNAPLTQLPSCPSCISTRKGIQCWCAANKQRTRNHRTTCLPDHHQSRRESKQTPASPFCCGSVRTTGGRPVAAPPEAGAGRAALLLVPLRDLLHPGHAARRQRHNHRARVRSVALTLFSGGVSSLLLLAAAPLL